MRTELDILAMQKVANLCGTAVMQAEKLAAAEKTIKDFSVQAEKLAAAEKTIKDFSMQAEKLAAAEKTINDFGKVRAGFAKRATEAAKVLAERGVIDSDCVDTYVDKVAEDMNNVWDTVEKLAEMVSAPTLGGVSHVESPRAADDPFIREFLSDNSSRGNGYID